MKTGVVNSGVSMTALDEAPGMLVVGSRKEDGARNYQVLVLARFGPEDLKQFAMTPEAARALAADLTEMATICSGEWRC